MHCVFEDRRYLIPFRATLLSQIFTDVLVIGGGVAGYRAAMAAAEHSEVIVALKGGIKHSSTYWAQGGIAAVVAPADSFDQHVRDTLTAGADLCDETVVRKTIEAGPGAIDELIRWGMAFDIRRNGDDGATSDAQMALGREGGHSCARILHADGDATGRVLAQTLDAQVRNSDRIRVFEQCFVLDLVTLEGSPTRCVGESGAMSSGYASSRARNESNKRSYWLSPTRLLPSR